MTYPDLDQSKYVGEWKDDERHGQGTFTRFNRDMSVREKYVGEWKSGQRHGKIIFTDPEGNTHETKWNEGEPI